MFNYPGSPDPKLWATKRHVERYVDSSIHDVIVLVDEILDMYSTLMTSYYPLYYDVADLKSKVANLESRVKALEG